MCRPDEEDQLLVKLREGADLWVVLENRFGEKKYVESYHLSSLVLRGDFFYGRFRHVHGPDRHIELFNPDLDDRISGKTGVSYGYTNFSRTVSTSSLEDCFCRIYSAHAYSRMSFKAKGNYRKVWDSKEKGDVGKIVQAVEDGARFKALVTMSSGVTYSLPVHTLEAYAKNCEFVAQTEFDGFPAQMLDFADLLQMGEQMMQLNERMAHIPGFYFSTPYKVGMPFVYPYFELSQKGGVEMTSQQRSAQAVPLGEVLMYSLFAA